MDLRLTARAVGVCQIKAHSEGGSVMHTRQGSSAGGDLGLARVAVLILSVFAAQAVSAQVAAGEAPATPAPAAQSPAEDEEAVPPATPPPAQAPPSVPAPAASDAAVMSDGPAASDGKVGDGDSHDEVIHVTGSLIGKSNLEGFSHVTVLTAKDIALSGITTVDELLRRLPTVTFGGINKNQNNAGDGLAWIDLRNLGVGRTLVLLNGRRFVGSTTGVAEGVDLNNIPIELIERVDVLLDGASAIYGSDAVAGVVNIRLREDFAGFFSKAYGGISQRGDSETFAASATMGGHHERGNTVVSVNFLERKEVRQRDRDWSRRAIVGAEYDEDGNIVDVIGSSATPEGVSGGYLFRPDPLTGRSYQPFDSPSDDQRYNFGNDQWLIGSQRRVGVTALATHELASGVEAFIEASAVHRESERAMAPEPLGLSSTANFRDSFRVPVTNPALPEDFLAALDPGVGSIRLSRRPIEMGLRRYSDSAVTYRGVIGVRGKLLDRLDWDVYINYGRNLAQTTVAGSVDLAKAIETTDPVLCALNANRGCVVGDWIGVGLQPEVVDYVRFEGLERKGIEQFSSGFTVGGELLPVLDAPLAAATGAVFRHEGGFTIQDPIKAQGDAASNGFDRTEGGYYGIEGFVEIELPLLKKRMFAEDLTVNVAGRFSHFSSFGSRPTFRSALTYAPSPDLRLRGVFSTAFRTPSITDLYGGAADSFNVFDDPCNDWDTRPDASATLKENCQAHQVPGGYNQSRNSSQIRTNIGGNSNLEAETAKVFDVGVVLTPQFHSVLQGFAVALDYYWLRVDNAIENPPVQYILDSCYASDGLSAPTCQAIRRDANGNIDLVKASVANIGELRSSGLDMSLGYAFPLRRFGLPDWGTLDLQWRGNYLLGMFETVDDEELSLGGKIRPDDSTYANWRWSLTAQFSTEHWTVRSLHRFIDGARHFNRDPTQPYYWVDAVSYWDLALQYQNDGFEVTLGCENVLNQDPPFFLDGGTANAEAASYDFVGRFFYMRAAHQF